MQDKELKHEFELERVILFSDAVFAIVITIMVLELKFPEGLRHAATEEVHKLMIELAPKFIAYAISFGLVSAFWLRHLKIFKTLRDYDVPLVVLNLVFLFIISLFPFAVSAITSSLSPGNYWSFDIYVTIILGATLIQTLIVQYLVKHKNRLCFLPAEVEDTLKWKVHRLNVFIIPAAFAILIAFNFLGLQQWVPYIIMLQAIILKRTQNKYYPKASTLARLLKNKEEQEISV
ncbi:DUF1211 domain-containing protein [Mucilaginibacter sp. HMF5004]|uniref:TMEM175 family protein n=1 Tax=Mucilaginibacter rivuli TaxID=2857527 RepID=UPI001C5EEF2F|nr:TMEM175 family protein [Mucilaginibacter rivuli]MBW4889087.1 DUF1211 domain-containing protein [Mucilaginibacter rivuli]